MSQYPPSPNPYGQNPYAQNQNSYGPTGPYGYPQPPLKHSMLGILSLVIGLIAGVGAIVSVVVCAMVVAKHPELAQNPDAFNDPNWVQNDTDGSMKTLVAGGLGFCCSSIFLAVGALLGILGLVVGPSKKLFASLGLGINALAIFALIVIWAIGQFSS